MKEYLYALIDRRDFGNLLSDDGISRLALHAFNAYNLMEVPSQNKVIALWSVDPRITTQLPEILVCQDGTQDDWAAWITTYAARIRPFSAYIRLLTKNEFDKFLKERPLSASMHHTWPIAGLILGEVLGSSNLRDKALETLSMSAFTSTLTFVTFRTAAIYPHFFEWSNLFKMWERTREITRQPARIIDSTSLARVCIVILDALDFNVSKLLAQDDIILSQACRQIINGQDMKPLKFHGTVFEYAENIMNGPREDRVRAFEEFFNRSEKNISFSNLDLMSLMLGYLVSRIAPGTLKHSSILEQVIPKYPTSVLWYGFFSAFPENRITIKNAGTRGIDLPLSARRVIRELIRSDDLAGAPICDISYLELQALSRTGDITLDSFATTTPSLAKVELLPGVYTSVNVSQTSKTIISQSRTINEREQEIIRKLGKHIASLNETYNSLFATEGSKKTEQPSLFPSKRKKK